MNKYLPNMYFKNVLKINYKKLKEKNIKLLLFDFDNTLISKNTKLDLKNFFIDLKKDFEVIIVSNTLKKNKLNKYCEKHNIKFIAKAGKPFSYGFNKLKEITSIKAKETCMIGDQLLTDVYGGNKKGYFTVLVDPFEKQELFLTKINRLIENKILEKNNLKRGDYYE